MSDSSPPAHPSKIVVCLTCRRHFPVTNLRIFDFIHNDLWPECCGKKMELGTPVDPPDKPPNAQQTDHPAQ